MKADSSCTEGPLGPLTAALQELRAAMTDPTQYDGEGGCGRAVSVVLLGRAGASGPCGWPGHSLIVLVAVAHSRDSAFGHRSLAVRGQAGPVRVGAARLFRPPTRHGRR